MKMATKERIESTVKIVGLCVAVFGVYAYFADRQTARDLETRRQSLGYVERYGGDELRVRREELFSFWLAHSDVAALINEEGASPDAYRAILMTALEAHPRRREAVSALYAVSDFFDQIDFCRSSGVCDRTILDQSFCAAAKDFSQTYGPLADSLAELSGSVNFGRGARNFGSSCVT